MRFRLPLLLLTLTAAIGLAACGGGDSDEDQIREAIETSATSTDPTESCETYVTQAFLEQVQFDEEGQAAVEACRESAGEDSADSATVTNIQVDGETATADAAIEGGGLDGQTISLGLVQEGDDWKLNSVEGFKDFDRDSYLAALEENIRADEDIPPAGQDCLLAGLGELSDQELQAPVIEGDISRYIEIFRGCQS